VPKNQPIDLTGKKFHYWTVISEAPRRDRRYWNCRCRCGTENVIEGSSLRRGTSRSCGCFKIMRTKETLTKHGEAPSPKHGRYTKTYTAWSQMKTRCLNPKDRGYKHYGGRGIKICDEWLASYEAFRDHVGESPSTRHSLGRTDNDGNYEPGNVRWETQRQQHLNRRVTVRLTHRGVTLSLYEWAEVVGMRPKMLADRIRRGWEVEDALFRPKRTW
jgi:hypothetical protein